MILKDKQFVDVRSPAEFEEYALPGAVNIPLFSNEERADIGTTYKKSGKETAIQEGLKIVGPKLSDHYKKMKELKRETEGKELVVYCWRGGMRSGSFVSTMQMLGIDCEQLPGGIRSIRKKIEYTFEHEAHYPKKYIVLSGGTGTAKTLMLEKLQLEGYPVIDLEGLANHRGSAFGQIGMQRKSQKQFELDLWQRIMELKNSSYIIIEGESRRIGDIFLPDFITEGKGNGRRLEVSLPIEQRLSVISDTYHPWEHHEDIKSAIERIKNKLTSNVYEKIIRSLERKDYRDVILLLLYHYYDPRYNHAFQKYEDTPLLIDADNIHENFRKIRNYLHYTIEGATLTPKG
ncbi:tRNA 2-selenouridine(34) synthase MnmH [Salibacterium salarium]|uniref:tRNA 2-selenouridine(34) synthase MnmH n=1 Tax=Salibacterium salarium TaxID=284579 RepID=A0A3R9QKP2_9BACI|nr:tRNA 2-selenouridine(34) synthase MnmH [Salibacterium salarium]RSL32496.1 tRNA 2-selenouridine(34) synthase MnmH [Salibacterium salarium]